MIRAGHKGVLIQVPKKLHLELKQMAKHSGKSMQIVGLYAIQKLMKEYQERGASKKGANKNKEEKSER